MPDWQAAVEAVCSDGKGGIYIAVHAQPGARKAQLRGVHGQSLKLAISEAAQDGKANAAVVRAIAEGLQVGRADVEITTGMSSRQKRVFVRGDAAVLKVRLTDWLAEAG